MLDSAELTFAIAGVLLLAFWLGWLVHWIWSRLVARALSDTERLSELATRADEAERAREQAVAAREMAEKLLAEREAEMKAEMEKMQTRLDGAIEGREAALTEELREVRADAAVSMEGLRSARAQVLELEAEIEELRTAKKKG